jgi:molybdopterin-guanine dinucleotide biosynthesis protein A
MWTAAILAGGEARRLGGQDKGALTVGRDGAARSIRERQLAVLHSLTPHILIIGRDGISDRVPGAGALGGLYTALQEAATDRVLVLACDMPFVTAPFLARLAEVGAATGAEAVVPRDARGRHPLCASYDRRVAARLRARIDAARLRVLEALSDLDVREFGPDELAPFDPDGRLLTNVNTPEDYARAQTR